jgi:hypothetical protein
MKIVSFSSPENITLSVHSRAERGYLIRDDVTTPASFRQFLTRISLMPASTAMSEARGSNSEAHIDDSKASDEGWVKLDINEGWVKLDLKVLCKKVVFYIVIVMPHTNVFPNRRFILTA